MNRTARAFWPAVVVGWTVIVTGIVGTDRPLPLGAFARWLVGLAVVHDAVVVPLAIGIAAVAVGRLPASVRAVASAALVATAIVVAFAWPALRGYGRLSTNPSLLPNNYAHGVLWTLGVVWLAAAVAAAVAIRRGRRE